MAWIMEGDMHYFKKLSIQTEPSLKIFIYN